jgi:PAS domain S-box-containing protein
LAGEPSADLPQGHLEALQGAFEEAEDPVCITDLNGRALYLNRAAREFIGVSVGEMEEKGGPRAFIEPSERLDGLLASAAGGERGRAEVEVLSGRGGKAAALLKASPVLDAGGRPAAVLLLGTDLGGRLEARRELERREAYYRRLIEQVKEVILVLGRDGRIRYLSPSYKNVFGFSIEEVLGRSAFDFLHPDDHERVGRLFAEGVDRPGHEVKTEYRILHKDGGWRLVEAVGRNLLDDPAVEGIVVNSRDITEERRAEGELRAAEQRYRSLVENVGDIIFTLGRDGRAVSISPAFERVSGWKVEEWLGRSFIKLVHPDDRDLAVRMFERVMRGESPPLYELRFRNSKGEYMTGEFVVTPQYGQGGVTAMLGVGRDITGRKRIEEALRASEERLRRITDNMMDMVSQVSAEGLFEYIGPSHRTILGYEPQDMLGRSIFEFLHPDDLERLVAEFARGLQEPGAVKAQYRYRHADGHYLWLESMANPVFNERGDLVGAVIGTRDITQRKRTEERLEKLNRCFLSLGADFQENLERLVVAGREIIGCGLLLYFRVRGDGEPEVYASWEGEEAEMSREAMQSLLRMATAQGPGRVAVLYRNGGDLDQVFAGERPRGMERLMACPVRLGEEVAGLLCAADGKREAFSKEEEEIMGMLARSLSMQEDGWDHERSLRDFINITSHELRHPLGLMKGYAEVLRSFGDDLERDKWEKAVESIDKGVERLDQLVSELLDVSRIEKGAFTIYRREVDLERMMRTVVEEMKERGYRNPFRWEADEGLKRCWADPEKLSQLLVILLDNAAKYSPPGEEITLRAGERVEEVEVSVADRGPGVPQEEREKIFGRLYQVGSAIYHSKPGVGLGLYIARKIVEAHGGRIWCEDNPGGGAVFRFTLPRRM